MPSQKTLQNLGLTSSNVRTETPNFRQIEPKIVTYPVGLITADETNFAGNVWYDASQQNVLNYLNTDNYYMTSSPSDFSNLLMEISNFSCNYYLTLSTVNNFSSVRPVLSLTPEYCETLIGTGTMTDPYRAA